MTSRDDALKALEDRDWSGATVEHAPQPTMIVHSVRLPADLSRWLEEQATRLDIKPSALIRNLVERASRPDSDEETVTVRVSELRREVQQAVDRAIARAA